MSCAQFANPARVQTDQAFESRTTDVVIVKFGFVEGELTPGRAITIDTPAIGINRTLWNGMYVPNVRRFAEPNEANASIQAAACTVPATVHVLPSPGAAALAAMGLLRACRRQPRTSQAQM